jgi:ubiquinone biosynthesis protein COQ9
MTVHSIEIRDTLLETILLHVRDKGWSWEDVTEAAQICGYQDDMASSMFPGGFPMLWPIMRIMWIGGCLLVLRMPLAPLCG